MDELAADEAPRDDRDDDVTGTRRHIAIDHDDIAVGYAGVDHAGPIDAEDEAPRPIEPEQIGEIDSALPNPWGGLESRLPLQRSVATGCPVPERQAGPAARAAAT